MGTGTKLGIVLGMVMYTVKRLKERGRNSVLVCCFVCILLVLNCNCVVVVAEFAILYHRKTLNWCFVWNSIDSRRKDRSTTDRSIVSSPQIDFKQSDEA